MSEKTRKDNIHNPQHFQMVLNIFMVSVMLVCFAMLIGQVIQTYYPAWGAFWFPALTFLITFVSMLMRYIRQLSIGTRQEAKWFAIVEAILILFIAKLLSLFFTVPIGWVSIWQEISTWGDNFLENFVNLDFLLRAFFLLIIWLITWLFSAPLNQLQEDEQLMAQEKLGYTFTDRYQARRRLIALIFNLGITMIILMVAQNNNLVSLPEDYTPPINYVAILLVYFSTAFLFLAFNQYSIMKARWYFSDIKVNPNLAQQWVLFSIFFIFTVILLIIFLPTGFTIEFGVMAKWLIDAFLAVISFLFSIFIAPFVFVMVLIEKLFNGDPIEEPIQEIAPEMPELLPQTISTLPWWEVVKSLFFWLVFFAVIFIAIRYYFVNKPNLKHFLSNLQFFNWLKDFWKWLTQAFKQVQEATVDTFQSGLEKIQTFLRNQQTKTPAMINLAKRLPARQAVILIYIEWIHWNRKHGLVRLPSQTPMEYAQSYQQFFQDRHDLDDTVKQFTTSFIQARYSRQPVAKKQVIEAQKYAQLLKKSFSGQQDAKESHP